MYVYACISDFHARWQRRLLIPSQVASCIHCLLWPVCVAGMFLIGDLQTLHVLRWPVGELWANELLTFLLRDPAEPTDYHLYCGVRNIPLYKILRYYCSGVSSIVPSTLVSQIPFLLRK